MLGTLKEAGWVRVVMVTLPLASGERQKPGFCGKDPAVCVPRRSLLPTGEVCRGLELRVGMGCCGFSCVFCGVWSGK